MPIKRRIIATFEQVAKEQNKIRETISDDLPLLDSGLASLCIAIIVARLEDQLGIDPFFRDEEVEFPTTIGEFISLYENAAD
jgi:acyl carrier protein